MGLKVELAAGAAVRVLGRTRLIRRFSAGAISAGPEPALSFSFCSPVGALVDLLRPPEATRGRILDAMGGLRWAKSLSIAENGFMTPNIGLSRLARLVVEAAALFWEPKGTNLSVLALYGVKDVRSSALLGSGVRLLADRGGEAILFRRDWG